jgi:hypothetical protein
MNVQAVLESIVDGSVLGHCPACFIPVRGFIHMTTGGNGPSFIPAHLIGYVLCNNCGCIYGATHALKPVALTREERKLIRSYHSADRMRELQEKIVGRLWG